MLLPSALGQTGLFKEHVQVVNGCIEPCYAQSDLSTFLHIVCSENTEVDQGLHTVSRTLQRDQRSIHCGTQNYTNDNPE